MEFSTPEFGGRPPIDGYGDGGFRIDQKRVKGSMLLLPDGSFGPWAAATPEDILPSALTDLLTHREVFDLILIGTGATHALLPKDTRVFLREEGVHAEIMTTGAAARTYNVLLGEGRRIGAALLAVA